MILEDLLLSTACWPAAAPLVPDPFGSADALLEAQLLDVRVDAVSQTLGALFDLRTSLQYDAVSTGLLLARGVTAVEWHSRPRPTARTAWSVSDLTVIDAAGGVAITLKAWPAPGLTVAVDAASVAFAVGEVAGLGDTIADYGVDDDAAVRAWTATWSSQFELRGIAARG